MSNFHEAILIDVNEEVLVALIILVGALVLERGYVKGRPSREKMWMVAWMSRVRVLIYFFG